VVINKGKEEKMSPEERGELEKALDFLVENLDVFLREFQIEKNEATISAFFTGCAVAFFSSIKTDKPIQEDLQELKKVVDNKIKSMPLY
jgi:hypothetical protein